ncbi:hypothetical protein L7F22_033840 [Adiantum nelumboides]|nr:hypothetical protein [Adiantum nelumboides]
MKNLSVHMMGGGRDQGYGYGRAYGSNEGFVGGRGRGMAGRGDMFQCYNCGEWGHKSPQCDKPKRIGGDMFPLPSQIPSRAQDYGIEIKGEAGPSGLTVEEKGKTKPATNFCRFIGFCKISKNDGISGLVSNKLDKNNFHAWKFRMTNFLMGKGYWDYIDGNQEEMPKLPYVNPTAEQIKAFKDWNQGARKVMYWLSVSVQDTMIGHIQDAISPKQAWDRLVSVDTINTKARKIQLKNELNTVKKENLSINDYTLKIKGIVESLASIGVQVEDDDKVEHEGDGVQHVLLAEIEGAIEAMSVLGLEGEGVLELEHTPKGVENADIFAAEGLIVLRQAFL